MEAGKFEIFLKNSISLVEFKVKNLKKDLDLNQANDKIKFLNQVSQILSKTKNEFEKEVYIEKISENYGISKEAIYGELNKIEYANSRSEKILESKVTIKQFEAGNRKNEESVIEARENLLIFLLLNYGLDVYQKIKDNIFPEDLKEEKNKKIIKILYEELEKGDISNVIGLFENDEELLSHVTYILSKEMEMTDIDKAVQDLIRKFAKDKLTEEKNEILRKLSEGRLNEDETKDQENRLKEIIVQLVKLK